MYPKEFQEMKKEPIHKTKTAEVKFKANKPLFGTKEWAPYNENCLVGCSHDCKYCYAKATAIFYKRTTAQDWKNETLRPGILQKVFRKRDGRIFFPSSHDITPVHLHDCMTYLEHMLSPGNQVLVVSKPHLDCIKAVCGEFSMYKDKILFRFTIGSSDSNTLKLWEPNAPDFAERLESLKFAFSEGYQTSVSCEPMLDDKVADVINQVSPFVTDTIWLGIANYLRNRLSLNGQKDAATREIADALIAKQSKGFIPGLYAQYKDNPQIRWKDSIKKVIGFDK